MGLYSVSVASQNNTYYTCLNIVNFIDPIPAFAGMTKKENKNDKGNNKTTPACGHPSIEGTFVTGFKFSSLGGVRRSREVGMTVNSHPPRHSVTPRPAEGGTPRRRRGTLSPSFPTPLSFLRFPFVIPAFSLCHSCAGRNRVYEIYNIQTCVICIILARYAHTVRSHSCLRRSDKSF